VGVRQRAGDRARDLGDHRMTRRRAGMTEKDGVRLEPHGLCHDLGGRHRTEFAVDEP
jgi:hypothetical protein